MFGDNLPDESRHVSAFERIRRVNAAGHEFWSSRNLAEVLGYTDYRNFDAVIGKAKAACFSSGFRLENHFVDVTEMVQIGSGAERAVSTVYLSRYACYLVVQNADPTNKPVVAVGQSYFAIQTRRQELADQGITDEDALRVHLRDEMTLHNRKLSATAKQAGVITGKDYAIFQNNGYIGLYGGLNAQEIKERKKLKKSQQILDHMGSTELAANLFRATQAEEKIRRDRISGKDKANQAHREVGAKVRQTIREIGGTMPEDLPTPEIGISKLKRQIEKAKSGKQPKKITKKSKD